jgi:hypothetical protein
VIKKNVLVFPCGSEIALEIYRSLQYSPYFDMFGANSVDDHGRFVFEKYVDGLPFIDDEKFILRFKGVIKKFQIDIIYPAMDSVISRLKLYENELGCLIIGSPLETAQICLSKELTYQRLENVIHTPKVYLESEIESFPVFVKPKIGYGSRGAKKIYNYEMLLSHLVEYPESIISEFLSGEEYTVDCFTDMHGKLRFCGARLRKRISNGISVNTISVDDSNQEFSNIANRLNENLIFRGAWFLQLKRNSKGELVLLEIASRLGGSSSLYRNKGVNFAQLSLFDAMGFEVEILENNYKIELDRALENKYKLDIHYDEVFIDFDDCILLENRFYNADLMKFIFNCINKEIKVTILSRHKGDLNLRLNDMNITSLFKRVICIEQDEKKSDYIDNLNSIFIDDSFSERKEVFEKCKIPVFSPDAINGLII